jgi:hypothetical protein
LVTDKRTESSEARADVNRQVRLAVKRFDVSGLDEDSWNFLCECGEDDCQDWVTLRVSEYEALQRADEPILAPGHTLTRGQRTRRKARSLVDDAKALEAQAGHQIKRAKRNVGKAKPS